MCKGTKTPLILRKGKFLVGKLPGGSKPGGLAGTAKSAKTFVQNHSRSKRLISPGSRVDEPRQGEAIWLSMRQGYILGVRYDPWAWTRLVVATLASLHRCIARPSVTATTPNLPHGLCLVAVLIVVQMGLDLRGPAAVKLQRPCWEACRFASPSLTLL